MKNYNVVLTYRGEFDIDVEAENASDAIDLAQNEIAGYTDEKFLAEIRFEDVYVEEID